MNSVAFEQRNLAYNDIACSDDGRYVFAASDYNGRNEQPTNGGFYRSTDYGETFTVVSSSGRWNAVACSPSGQYVVTSVDRTIMASSNYGASFAPVYSLGTSYTSDDYPALWISSNGLKIILGVSISQSVIFSGPSFGITVSEDRGVSWSDQLVGGYFRDVAASSDGMQVTAVDGRVKVSPDGGGRWVSRELGRDFRAVVMSQDGRGCVAAAYNGQIYYSDGTVMSRESGETASFIYTGSGVWMPLTSR